MKWLIIVLSIINISVWVANFVLTIIMTKKLKLNKTIENLTFFDTDSRFFETTEEMRTLHELCSHKYPCELPCAFIRQRFDDTAIEMTNEEAIKRGKEREKNEIT